MLIGCAISPSSSVAIRVISDMLSLAVRVGTRRCTSDDSRTGSVVVHDFVAGRSIGRLQQLHQRSYILQLFVVPAN